MDKLRLSYSINPFSPSRNQVFFSFCLFFHLDNFKYPTGHWSPVTHGIALTVTVDSERRADCDVPTPSLLPISPAFATSLWIEGCVAAGWTRDGVNGARYVMYMIYDVVRPPTGFILQSH